jgi:hypothetical protein
LKKQGELKKRKELKKGEELNREKDKSRPIRERLHSNLLQLQSELMLFRFCCPAAFGPTLPHKLRQTLTSGSGYAPAGAFFAVGAGPLRCTFERGDGLRKPVALILELLKYLLSIHRSPLVLS